MPTFREEFEAFEEAGVGAIPALIEALHHDHWRVRAATAHLLDFFGPDAVSALPDLLKAIQAEPMSRVRRQLLAALNSIGEIPAFALPQLLRRMRDQDHEAAALAMRAVSQFGPTAEEALPWLMKRLDHPSFFIHSSAAYALGTIGFARPDVIETLIQRFSTDEHNVSAITRALAQLAPDRLSEHLLDRQGPLPQTNLILDRRFEDTLFALAHLGQAASPLFPAVFELYKRACQSAFDHFSDKAEEILLCTLSRMGHHAAEAIPFLMERALKKRERQDFVEDPSVRRHYLKYSTYRALRSILMDTFLQEGHQQRLSPQATWLQVKARVLQAGPSHKQQHILASLEKRVLQEHDLLQARVKLRDLSPEHLRLAADLGYTPALRAMQIKLPLQQDQLSSSALRQWSQDLARYGPEVCSRIGHALGRASLHIWEYHYLSDYLPFRAVLALENWIYAPRQVSRESVKKRGHFGLIQGGVRTSYCAAYLTMSIADLVEPVQSLESVFSHAIDAWRYVYGFDYPPQSIVPMHRKRALAQIRQTIREMLLPWLLESRDPVRDALAPLAELDSDTFFLR